MFGKFLLLKIYMELFISVVRYPQVKMLERRHCGGHFTSNFCSSSLAVVYSTWLDFGEAADFSANRNQSSKREYSFINLYQSIHLLSNLIHRYIDQGDRNDTHRSIQQLTFHHIEAMYTVSTTPVCKQCIVCSFF